MQDLSGELTEPVPENDERKEVYEDRDELCEEHERVPGANSESHHSQLGQDEGGEADGHDVDELLLKQQQRSKYYDATLVDRDKHPDEERFVAQTSSLHQFLVKLRVGDGDICCNVYHDLCI